MVCEKTISRDNANKLNKQMISEAADEIATCGNDLLIVAETIAQSCLMLGDDGNDYRKVLSLRAQSFMMLAGLYQARSRRFEGIVKRLEGGMQEDI